MDIGPLQQRDFGRTTQSAVACQTNHRMPLPIRALVQHSLNHVSRNEHPPIVIGCLANNHAIERVPLDHSLAKCVTEKLRGNLAFLVGRGRSDLRQQPPRVFVCRAGCDGFQLHVAKEVDQPSLCVLKLTQALS